MTDTSKKSDRANYGIIGNVQAHAVAVGDGSRAVSNVTTTFAREEFDTALRQLREEISRLSISASAMAALRTDLDSLTELREQSPPTADRAAGLLDGLIAKLKMVGVVVETMKPLAEPIKAIATMCGITLPF